MFDALPVEEDHIRTEDAAYQAQLAMRLHDVYEALGYDITIVPAVPPDDRVSLILERLATLYGTL
jgi:predicted ATPase